MTSNICSLRLLHTREHLFGFVVKHTPPKPERPFPMSSLCTTAVSTPTIRRSGVRARAHDHGHAGRARHVRWDRLVSMVLLIIVLGWAVASLAAGQAQAQNPSTAPVILVVVQQGDTLWDLSREHAPEGLSTLEYAHIVAQANEVRPGLLVPGSVLMLPSQP